MYSSILKKVLLLTAALLAAWLGVKYLLPVLLPFFMGAAIALTAEPFVSLGQRRLKLRRVLAAGVGVSLTLILLLGILSILGALAVKELGRLAAAVPDLEETASQGMQLLEDWMVGIAGKTPEGVRPVLTGTVLNFFDDGNTLMEQMSRRIPAAVSSVLGWVPDGALGIGTGLLSGFLISGRLPQLKKRWQETVSPQWQETYLPTVRRIRHALSAWVKAQLKLMLVSYGIVSLGFLLLNISHGLLWAALVALVDAVPLLGTGTVLLPWALVCFLQDQHFRAIGLLCIYGAAMLTRTVLEPKLVGKQLGLDPLLTLLALYLGYRFWGFAGMLLAPVLAAAVKSAATSAEA